MSVVYLEDIEDLVGNKYLAVNVASAACSTAQ